MGQIRSQSQHLNFSLRLFITFFWTFCVLKENLYFAQSRVIKAIFGSNKAKIQKIDKVSSLYFSEILCDVEFFGSLWYSLHIKISVSFVRMTMSNPTLFW